MSKRKKRRLVIILCVTLSLAVFIGGLYLFLHRNQEVDGSLTFSCKRCSCDADFEHTKLALAFRYTDGELCVEFICTQCDTTIALVDVSCYPLYVNGSISRFNNDAGAASLIYMDMSPFTGNEPRIFDEIKKLSQYNNVANIVYEDSRRVMSVLELYEYSDWSKYVIDQLGVFKSNAYKIIFEPNGGNGIMNEKYLLDGYLPECHYMLDGYLFDGWALSSDGEKIFEDGDHVKLTDNVTLYACWIVNPYKIHITSNNEEYGNARIDYLYGRTLSIVATPNTGCQFLGWYDEKNTLISQETNYTFPLPEHDVIYTAVFEPCAGTVRVVDGGVGYLGDTNDCLSGTKVEIYAGVRAGYEFGQWTVSRGNVTLSDPTSPTASFVMSDESVVITATWKKITGIVASVNDAFLLKYRNKAYFNGACYDIDKGITLDKSMVSVSVEFLNGTKRIVSDFEMEPTTLSQIGVNTIPVSLTINNFTYSTEIVIQGYSSSLYKLMTAAGIDADSFQAITILISEIQSGLLFAQSTLHVYSDELNDLYTSFNNGSLEKDAADAELDTVFVNVETVSSRLADYEFKISSVSQQTRTLMAAYKGEKSQAIIDAFDSLGVQIQGLTERILYTCDTLDNLKTLYAKVDDKLS